MKIAIISRCIRENGEKRGQRICLKMLDDGLYAAEIAFKAKEKPSERRVRKYVLRAARLLDADKLIYAGELRKYEEYPFDLSEVFYKIAPNAARAAARHFKINEQKSVAIRVENPSGTELFIAEKLIYDCKNILLLTDRSQKGKRVADAIMEKFGAAVEIFPYNYISKGGITIDTDKSEILVFGRYALKDFEAEEELYGYDVNSLELAAARNRDFDKIHIKSCLCGKNKLTLEVF